MPYPVPPDIIPGAQANWDAIDPIAAVGDPLHSGYEYQPSCHWITGQFLTYESEIIIGVLANHSSAVDNLPPIDETGTCGIDRVEFIANDGAATTVAIPTPHPVTGWWGWWATLKAVPLTSTPVEVRAIAYPHSGIPMIVQGNYKTSGTPPASDDSLVLWSNATGAYTNPASPKYLDAVNGDDELGEGTLAAPWKTVRRIWSNITDCNNLIIKLLPGTYLMPSDGGSLTALSRWCHFSILPEHTRDQVIITNGDNPLDQVTRVRLIRLTDVTIDRSEIDSLAPFKGSSSQSKVHVWPEGCDYFSDARDIGFDLTGSRIASPNTSQGLGQNAAVSVNRMTDSERYRGACHDLAKSPQPYFMHGVDFWTVSSDLANRPFVRGCTWRDQRGTKHVHGDWAQTLGVQPNAIWMDNICYDAAVQLIFQHDTKLGGRQWAFVNNVLDNGVDGKGGFITSQYGCVYWFNTVPFQRQKFVLNTQEHKYWTGEYSQIGYETRTAGPYGVEKSKGSSFFGNIWAMNYADGEPDSHDLFGYHPLPISPITEENFTEYDDFKFNYNHYSGSHTFKPGDNMTSGFVTFRDRANGDFYVLDPPAITDSPVPAIVPWDALQRARHPMTRHGALESDILVELIARAPRATPPARSYETARNVTLSSNTGSVIRFTADGSEPTEASTVYVAPIAITANVTIKAKAWKDGLDPSPVATHVFQIRNDGIPDSPTNVKSRPLQ